MAPYWTAGPLQCAGCGVQVRHRVAARPGPAGRADAEGDRGGTTTAGGTGPTEYAGEVPTALLRHRPGFCSRAGRRTGWAGWVVRAGRFSRVTFWGKSVERFEKSLKIRPTLFKIGLFTSSLRGDSAIIPAMLPRWESGSHFQKK